MASKPRLDVHLYVTPRCNLSCSHCYYDAYDRSRHPDNLISLDEVSGVLSGLCARFDADVSLEGGEPFLRVGIDRTLAEVDPDVLRTITVTTNGTVPIRTDPKVLRGLGMLRLSVDGHVDEMQQALRGVDVAPVLRTCVRLRNSDVPFWIRMTLWKRNIRLLREIYAWVQANDIDQLSLFEYQSSGRGVGMEPVFGVSAADVEVLLDDLVEQPRPACLRRLTVNLAERRVDTVLRRRHTLEGSGCRVVELPEVPNCTVNYDGTVGISPWRVTADGAPDVFTTMRAHDYLDTIEAAARGNLLADRSGCISRIQLRIGS